jgi:hypothetical protein
MEDFDDPWGYKRDGLSGELDFQVEVSGFPSPGFSLSPQPELGSIGDPRRDPDQQPFHLSIPLQGDFFCRGGRSLLAVQGEGISHVQVAGFGWAWGRGTGQQSAEEETKSFPENPGSNSSLQSGPAGNDDILEEGGENLGGTPGGIPRPSSG